MRVGKAYSVKIETDQEGLFFKFPDGWLIEPENSDVLITSVPEDGRYVVTPIIGEDGLPNCKFIFPETDFE